MNEELKKAAAILQENGIAVDLPKEDEDKEALQDKVSALEAAIADLKDGKQASAPAVIGNAQSGVTGGLGYLKDKFGIEVNTPMHTTRSGYGSELVPSAVLSDQIVDLAPKYETFLQVLPGNHGNDLELSKEVPIIGEDPLFKAGAEKTADSAFGLEKGANQIATDKVTITQKQYYTTIDITDFLRRFNVAGQSNFDRLITDKLAKGYSRTKEAVIINGDTETGATGNVNSDDGAPTAGTYYLNADGLRKKAIVTTAPNADPDLGTLELADMRTLENLLGHYFADPSLCTFITNMQTYNKFKSIDTFNNAATRGEMTVFNGNKVTTFDGAPIFVNRDFGLTEADGKQSTTASSNTKGGMILLYTPAIQYGSNGDLQFKLYDYGRQGIQMEVWFYFGFAVINQDAGITDTLVANGINITV